MYEDLVNWHMNINDLINDLIDIHAVQSHACFTKFRGF